MDSSSFLGTPCMIITFTPELFKLRHTFLMLLFFKAYLTRNVLKHTALYISTKEILEQLSEQFMKMKIVYYDTSL
jgi:hypothetical protein